MTLTVFGENAAVVCAASGDLPNMACPQTAVTWFIPDVSPIKANDVHRRVMIDTRSNLTACPPYDLNALVPKYSNTGQANCAVVRTRSVAKCCPRCAI
jgi:hypothetical protein